MINSFEFVSELGMKSNFAQIDLPNSWIGALVLRQIKQDWAVPNKITFRDLINAQEILAANFKFFKKSVKQIINLNDFIKLTLLCKAAVFDFYTCAAQHILWITDIKISVFRFW